MGIKEEILKAKKDLEEIKTESSLVMELLKDAKTQNKRQFIIILVLIACWFITGGYLIYILNDIGVVETTQEIQDINSIEGSNIINGGSIYGEDKTNEESDL